MAKAIFRCSFITLIGLILFPVSSRACVPPRFSFDGYSTLPTNEAKNIPRNTQIRIIYSGSGLGASILAPLQIRAVTAQGLESEPLPHTIKKTVAQVWRWGYGHYIVVLELNNLLPSNQTIKVLGRLPELPCSYTQGDKKCVYPKEHKELSRFTTSAHVDEEAPTFRGLEGFNFRPPQVHEPESCDSHRYLYLSMGFAWSPATDNTTPTKMLRYNVYKSTDLITPIFHLVTGIGASLECPGTWGETYQQRIRKGQTYIVRAVDLAGNEDHNLNFHTIPDKCQGLELPPPEPPPTYDAGNITDTADTADVVDAGAGDQRAPEQEGSESLAPQPQAPPKPGAFTCSQFSLQSGFFFWLLLLLPLGFHRCCTSTKSKVR